MSIRDFFTSKNDLLTSTTTIHQLSDTSFIVQGCLPQDLIPSMKELLTLSPGVPDTVIMLGKPVKTPRFVAHYLKPYYYTGKIHEAKPLPDSLKPLLKWCNYTTDFKRCLHDDCGKCQFNQALVNYYMDGSHYIGKHSDDERQLVGKSSIFSASFGETRIFRIRDKKDSSIVKDLILTHGSYVVMCGDTQKEFTHEIPKINGVKGEKLKPRVNVTFRIFK